ncbi:MAG TPA: hypothetical protein VLA19_23340 [Herpetosiphonaceae bacterium]|nr:hypothetical protein [Herpetosiphonaceae bacterium]
MKKSRKSYVELIFENEDKRRWNAREEQLLRWEHEQLFLLMEKDPEAMGKYHAGFYRLWYRVKKLFRWLTGWLIQG